MLLITTQSSLASKNEETYEDILNGLKNSFYLPFEDLNGDKIDTKKKETWLDSLKSDAGFGLEKRKDGHGYFPILNGSLKFVPFGDWFAEFLFFYYTEKNQQEPWDADFFYRFGYEDWRPYTLSLIYSNYGGNRSYTDIYDKYRHGTYVLTWSLPVPDSVAQPFLIETDREITCSLGLHYSSRYSTAQEESGHDKFGGKLTFNAPIYRGWYVSFSLFYYLDSSQQQPWDSDYTYEIGWRGEEFSISYKNYGGTRFPWRSGMPHDSGFADGSVGITWHLNWIQ